MTTIVFLFYMLIESDYSAIREASSSKAVIPFATAEACINARKNYYEESPQEGNYIRCFNAETGEVF